ncbi:MAG: hypothetical protein RJA20_126 [Bacteroidota bacterium]
MKEQLSLRYPIGTFEYGKEYSNLDTLRQIREIAGLPKKLKKIVRKLREGALDKTYRQHGWTVRQVIHHLADSHINAYVRMKLAVTENAPIVKPYEEQLWAETEDGKHGSVGMSLKLLSALHKRWVFFLTHLSDEDLDRVYYNPSGKRTVQLREAIALYAWHGRHHLAHVKLVTGNKKHEAESEEETHVEPRAAKKGSRARPEVTAPVSELPKPRRGRPVVKKSEDVLNEGVVAPVSELPKPRRGRPLVKKSDDVLTADVVAPVSELSKPRRGRPVVKKSDDVLTADVVAPVSEVAKPKRVRRTKEEIEAAKEKKG